MSAEKTPSPETPAIGSAWCASMILASAVLYARGMPSRWTSLTASRKASGSSAWGKRATFV